MPQQKPYKVLLIGDSCIDEYVYGTVERLNPEAPVPILKYKRTEQRQGMSWNVYNNLKSFGIEVYMMTNQEKIVKTRYIDEKTNQQILRVDNEVVCKPMEYEIPKEKYDVVVISDYNKGFITSEKMFEIVHTVKCPVFIDTKKTVLPEYNCYVKINEQEYNGLDTASKKNAKNIIVTYGDRGAVYDGVLYPGEKVNVYDVVGAGDTFLSALVYFYLECARIEKAIPYANKAAAIAVQNRGTYVLTENDIDEICD
jgi:D-beta-D-heptose 7-phosphate kinase/D-beta-D-heptose 1-phosphate adenosyltransferase